MSYPSGNTLAPRHQRYIGMYHYSSYWNCWDKIVGFTDYEWIVEDHITGARRKHCTPMDARHFADKPFKVYPSTPI